MVMTNDAASGPNNLTEVAIPYDLYDDRVPFHRLIAGPIYRTVAQVVIGRHKSPLTLMLSTDRRTKARWSSCNPAATDAARAERRFPGPGVRVPVPVWPAVRGHSVFERKLLIGSSGDPIEGSDLTQQHQQVRPPSH